jgi:hypothetical protein
MDIQIMSHTKTKDEQPIPVAGSDMFVKRRNVSNKI